MKIPFSREEIHLKVYLFSLALLVCCLPLSRYMLSISQFLMALNWIAEGNFRYRTLKIRRKPGIMLFASVFLLYAVGFLFSENSEIALEKVKNALPILMLPLVMGTSEPLSGKTVKRLLLLFSSAAVAAALICIFTYITKGLPQGGDFRNISVFMPHIRFALLLDMAVVILLYFAVSTIRLNSFRIDTEVFLQIAGALFLTGFLVFLRSATGIVIFTLLIVMLAVNWAFKSPKKQRKYHILGIVSAITVSIATLVFYTWLHNFHVDPVNPATLEAKTPNGNPYVHDTVSGILENGHYLGIYVCEPELQREWKKLSDMPYDQYDLRGQVLNSTIKRYLTSKGLRKDSAGLHALTATDLFNIEKGQANYKFHDNPGLYQRLYETLWEIHIYQQNGYVEEHSIGQRLAFTKEAMVLMRENLWKGTGPGDVYGKMYKKMLSANLAVDPKWEGKPHNEFAFLILSFGLAGFIWILICWVYPAIRGRAYRILLFNLFMTAVLISMLVMDTLESYDSMVFFSFFYCLFVFGSGSEPSYS